ncbi:Tetraspanin-11 [Euphorbia peplus]|nr:Tetraspanin-11 [Euphorbia peplus]
MARASNIVLSIVNFIFLLAGIALIGASAYFLFNGAATVCKKLMVNPLLIAGACVSLISLLGLFGSCCQNNFMLGLYRILMVLMIFGLVVFAIFMFVVTNKSAGKVVSGHGVGDYSHWLQNHIVKGKSWTVFKNCLVDAQFCDSLGSNPSTTYSKIFNRKISPLQGVCCMPPSECEFEHRNGTLSVRNGETNDDCRRWSNKQSELCLDCDTCKAGFLDVIRKQWRNVGISFIILIVFTIIVFMTSSCAANNNSFENRLDQYHGRFV